MGSLIHWFQDVDQSLFLIINQNAGGSVLGKIMHFLSYPGKGFLLLAGVWLFLIVAKGRRGRVAAVLVAVSLAITDPVTVRVFKPAVARARPNHPDYLVENGTYRGGYNRSFSYPSAHAANAFGVAGVFLYIFHLKGVFWLILAMAIGYSRIYLGQHFPLDIAGGGMLGLIISLLICNITELFVRIKEKRK